MNNILKNYFPLNLFCFLMFTGCSTSSQISSKQVAPARVSPPHDSRSTSNLAKMPETPTNWSEFQAAVILKTYRGKNTYICSAVMLSKRLGITAAHCIAKSDQNEVLIGNSLRDSNLTFFKVDQNSIRVHPKNNTTHSYSDSDLAVFELKEDSTVDRFVSIPELSDDQEFHFVMGQPLERVGFGLRGEENKRIWTKVFYEQKDQREIYIRDAYSAIGDSGSPVFLRTGDTLSLIALHSTKINSKQVATVYLPYFKKWIYQ